MESVGIAPQGACLLVWIRMFISSDNVTSRSIAMCRVIGVVAIDLAALVAITRIMDAVIESLHHADCGLPQREHLRKHHGNPSPLHD